MNSFGLGLVLNFTDNASSGMRRVSQTFNEMNGLASQTADTSSQAALSVQTLAAAGIGLTIVGDQVTQIGYAMSGLFTNLIGTVTEVGTTVMGYKMTLNTLFKSAEEGEAAFEWVKEFAKTSIFNFENLLPAMTTMKSVGIDVRDEIVATSGATQNLLEYAGDLAAVFPQMKNAYGTGVNAAMGALKEYIAEGNAMSLKRGAGLDITQILGEDKGKSIEERTRQVADLIDQMGILGMTANLAGTPMQRLSNIQDTWFSMLTEISDSGVFEKYTSLIEKFTDYIFDIPDEELSNIAYVISDALVSLMSPLETVIDLGIALADWVRNLIKEQPGIAKLILSITAFTGVILIGAGYLMKFAGSIFLLSSAFTQMRLFALNGVSIFNIFGKAVSFAFSKVLPFVAIASVLYYAWQNNLFGIKDLVTNVFKDIGTIFSLTMDALSDNTLSEENFLLARDLGILPFIEAILQLKYHWGFFVEGFQKGFGSIFESINEFFSKFGALELDVFGLTGTVGELLATLTDSEDSVDNWERLGSAMGQVLAIALVLYPVIKLLSIAFKGVLMGIKAFGAVKTFILGIPTVITSVVGFFGKILAIGTKIGAFFSTVVMPAVSGIMTAIGGALTAVAAALGISVGWLVAIIAAVVAVVAAVIVYRDEIWAFFTNLGESISNFFSEVWSNVSAWWNGLMETIKSTPLYQTIASIFENIKNVVMSFVDNAVQVFQSFFNMVWTIIQGVAQVFRQVFEIVKAIVKNAIDIVVDIFQLLYEIVRVIIYSVIWVFQQVFNFIQQNVIQPFVDFFTSVFQWLKDNVLTPIGEFFTNLWRTAVDTVSPIIEEVSTVFNNVAETVMGVFESVKEFFVGIFDSITETAEKFFNWVSEKLGWIIEGINSVGSFFSNGISTASNFFQGVGDKVKKAVGLNTGGYVKSEGMAMLHPNEVVVNDPLTRRLGLFLDDYQTEPTNSGRTPVVVVNDDSKDKGEDQSSKARTVPVNTGNSQSVTQSTTQNDNSVNFSAGSIVLQVANATEAELEKAAEKLMKIIERKQQLKNMAVRT